MKRLAIFAIIRNNEKNIIRSEQKILSNITGNTLALNFPVHITLKGRFWAEIESVISSLESISFDSFDFQSNFIIEQPKYIENQLSWLEVKPSNQGFETLFCLHETLETKLTSLVTLDEVPEAHKNYNFRPHITLGWGISSLQWLEYQTHCQFKLDQVHISHIALACYSENWPYQEVIDIEFSMSV